MKKIFYLLFLLLFACNKQQTPVQQPAPQQNVQNNVSPNLNAQEIPLCFDWKLYKHYAQGVPGGPVIIDETFNNAPDCHLLLTCNTSANFPNGSYPNNVLKAATSALDCNPISGLYWFSGSPNILQVGSLKYYVQLVTNDTLILTAGESVSSYSQKYKFWK